MTRIDSAMWASADDALLALFSDPAVRANPYPAYHRLRDLAPVHRSEVLPLWILTRFDDCSAVLRDPRFGKSDEALRIFGGSTEAAGREVPIISQYSMLRMNPPDHTRMRGLWRGSSRRAGWTLYVPRSRRWSIRCSTCSLRRVVAR